MGKRLDSEREAAPSAARRDPPEGKNAGADGGGTPQDIAQALTEWQQSLRSVRRSIDEATRAVSTLRATLLEMAPLWRSLGELEQALKDIQWEEPAPMAEAPAPEAGPDALAVEAGRHAETAPPVAAGAPAAEAEEEAFALETETTTEEPVEEAERASVSAFSGLRRPLTAGRVEREPPASHTLTITVEDPGSETPLVPLYRALGRVGRIRDMDLVSYTNGVAVISVQSDDEIAGDDLQVAIKEALERNCRVISHERDGFLVRMEPH